MRMITLHMNGAMDNKTGRVHPPTIWMDDGAIKVNRYKAAGRYVAEQTAKRVDQKAVGCVGNAQCDMGVDEVRHPKMVDQPIAGC